MFLPQRCRLPRASSLSQLAKMQQGGHTMTPCCMTTVVSNNNAFHNHASNGRTRLAAATGSRTLGAAFKSNGFLVTDGLLMGVPRRPASSGDLPKHIRVTLPALSPTMQSGTIISWEKKVGDHIAEGDLLCEIETDKATMGFETPEEGFLAQVFLGAGAKDIPIGRLLCIIVDKEEDIEKFKDFKDDGQVASSSAPPAAAKEQEPQAPAKTAPPPQQQQRPSAPAAAAAPFRPPSSDGSRPFASPAAKKLAQDKGIDLSQISKGSGMDGMITTRDLENVSASASASSGHGAAAAGGGKRDFFGGMPTPMGQYSDAELSSMRKTIAKRLQASKLEIPHYYLTVECEMDAVMKLRAEINKQYEKEGVKLSVNDFVIKATALSCKRVPACNSAWMDTFIREFHSCDVSVAVDTGSGLITPIVSGAENRGLADISETLKELAGRAKAGKLQPHEFMGGTITVSNLGMFGIEHFTAIINPPQSCILAVGGTTKKLVPSSTDGASYETRQFMKVTLSCDHRVVDGAVGATWLKQFKKFMEQPTSMLL